MYRDAGHHSTTQQQPCFLPEECLSFAQSLHLYTLGAAYAAGTETHQGDIKQGWFNVAEVDSHGKISIIITSIEHDMISGEFRQKLVLSIFIIIITISIFVTSRSLAILHLISVE